MIAVALIHTLLFCAVGLATQAVASAMRVQQAYRKLARTFWEDIIDERRWPRWLQVIGRALAPFLEQFRRRRRCRAMAATVPHTIELLALSVAAGAEFMTALARVVEQLPPGLARAEWQRVLQAIRVGQQRSVALQQLGERVPLPMLRAVVLALRHADRFGAPLVTALQSAADDCRMAQLEQAERAGVVAGQAILLPIVFCIVPAALLLSLGGVLVGIINGGLAGGGWP